MWLAHALTLARIPIAIGFGWVHGNTRWAFALIALAALTDTLDGNVARWVKRRKQVPRHHDIGGWLDPLVDKLFVVIVIVVLWHHTHDVLILALIGARELVLVPLTAVYLAWRRAHHRASLGELSADPLGKAATVAQFVALAIVLAVPRYGLIAAGVAAVLGLIAAGHYIVREVTRMHRASREIAAPSAR